MRDLGLPLYQALAGLCALIFRDCEKFHNLLEDWLKCVQVDRAHRNFFYGTNRFSTNACRL